MQDEALKVLDSAINLIIKALVLDAEKHKKNHSDIMTKIRIVQIEIKQALDKF